MGTSNLKAFTKDIAAAATAENLVPDDGSVSEASKVLIQCPASNTSDLLLGDANSQVIVIAKGTSMELPMINFKTGNSKPIKLSDIWIKAGTNGDDVNVLVLDYKK